MITLVPVGGLANRMRAIDSAIALAREINSELRIVWFKDQGLNCRFDELFQRLPLDNSIILKEASFLDMLIYDRPRKKNFYLTKVFQRLFFNSCIYEDEVNKLLFQKFDFKVGANQKQVYIASWSDFFHSDNNNKLKNLFIPITSLQEDISHRTEMFSKHTIGIHIRRTDNIGSIKESPTELFIKLIKKEIEYYEEANFYLASDSEEDKRILIETFGERIMTNNKPADRSSVSGMQEALVEMYTLAQTKKILGSARSSYSEIAAQINGIECLILKK
jgi:hypothetical protein